MSQTCKRMRLLSPQGVTDNDRSFLSLDRADQFLSGRADGNYVAAVIAIGGSRYLPMSVGPVSTIDN
jgi:hypothetical protein